MSEIINFYDCDYNHLGTVEKDHAHRYGLWHDCVGLILVIDDQFVFARRSARKKFYPNILNTAAAGHIAVGEDLAVALCREAEEEIGVSLETTDLRYLGMNSSAVNINGQQNNEFNHIYIAHSPISLSEMRFDDGEVSGVYAAPLDQALAFFAEESETLDVKGYRGEGDNTVPDTLTVTLANDFPPQTTERFLLKACICAKQFIKGEKYIAF